jgi:prefoldin subunit 5
MTNEEILQKTLNSTLERMGKQAATYEAEIANLNAQLILFASRLEEAQAQATAAEKAAERATTKTTASKS